MRSGPQTVADWSCVAAAFFAPMNGFRISRYITVSDILVMAASVALAVAMATGPYRSAAPVRRSLLVGLAALAGGGLIGTLVAGPHGPDLAGVVSFVFTTAGSLAVVALWAPTRSQIQRFCVAWVGGALASSVWALTLSRTIAGRPVGFTSHPNNLGLTCMLAIGPVLGFALASERRAARPIAWVACGFLTSGLMASGSRAAVIGFCVVVPAVAFLSSHRQFARRAAFGAAGLGLALGVGVVRPSGHTVLGRIAGDRSTIESDTGRIQLLSRSLDRVREHPVTGEGFTRASEAHNIYLQVLVAAGPVGLLGLALVTHSILNVGFRGPQQKGFDVSNQALLTGLVVGYAGYLAAGWFQNNLAERYLWLYVAALVALDATESSAQSEAVRL